MYKRNIRESAWDAFALPFTQTGSANDIKEKDVTDMNNMIIKYNKIENRVSHNECYVILAVSSGERRRDFFPEGKSEAGRAEAKFSGSEKPERAGGAFQKNHA